MKKIILVDGNNLMFRSYFATAYAGSLMRNSKGQATNALYGFTSMINKIINEEKPTHIAVAFDIGKNFRHDKYKEYKAGRNETPGDLKSQMPIARTLLDYMGIKHLEMEGYEADDIIGTLAKEADIDPEFEALIVSSDHDLLQLISHDVHMKMLKSKDYTYYTEETFKEEYGFEPIKVIDLKSLMGDASDNIPGVKGIGEKTAKTLIQTYGSLDGVYSHIDEIKGKMKEKLESDKENAYFSFELATIYRDVPIEKDLSLFTYNGANAEKLAELYRELEFHSFMKNIDTHNLKHDNIEYKLVEKVEDIDSSALEFAYYIEIDKDNYHTANIMGMSLYDGTNAYFVPKDLIKEVIDSFKMRLRYTYSLKKNLAIANRLGVSLPNSDFDLMLAYYLLDNVTKDDLAFKMSDEGMPVYFYEELVKGKTSEENFINGIVLKSKFIYEKKDTIYERLTKEEMITLFDEVEMPLVRVLSDMEETGIRVEKSVLKEMQVELKAKIDDKKREIWSLAGEEFNVSSPKQLADILFNKLEIPYPGKASKGYSTDVSVLEKLLEYPIIEPVLEYRSLTKLNSTYAEPLEGFIAEDGKIHTIYKQTLTRTGRLSSVEPNMQNIPTREEEARLIKRAFIPEEGALLLSADYSQIELRILAHISGDETMINAFKNGEDIHKRVAADIYGVPLNEVTKLMRSTAKHVIFGIVYGISGFGLGENLHISPKKAKEFIEKYYALYPKVKEYMDSIKKEAYEKGYVKTLFNRRRYIEELKSPVYNIRSGGERIALNTPIQGTGADIIKMAMNSLYAELNKKGMKSKILLQVHDEVILNVYEDELESVKEMVKRNMEGVCQFEVPLLVEIGTGKNWYEAK